MRPADSANARTARLPPPPEIRWHTQLPALVLRVYYTAWRPRELAWLSANLPSSSPYRFDSRFLISLTSIDCSLLSADELQCSSTLDGLRTARSWWLRRSKATTTNDRDSSPTASSLLSAGPISYVVCLLMMSSCSVLAISSLSRR